MGKWLGLFVYRPELDITTFIGSGIIVIVFTLVIISYQSTSSARINPVDSLKHE